MAATQSFDSLIRDEPSIGVKESETVAAITKGKKKRRKKKGG
jgi:hypothetical protein